MDTSYSSETCWGIQLTENIAILGPLWSHQPILTILQMASAP